MDQVILDLIAKFPVLASIVMGIGIMRLIFKPLFTFLTAVTEATPTPVDNAWLKAIMDSKIYVWISYALDWFGSIKLPQNPPTPPNG